MKHNRQPWICRPVVTIVGVCLLLSTACMRYEDFAKSTTDDADVLTDLRASDNPTRNANCGNGICEQGEPTACHQDCGGCGDGMCGENECVFDGQAKMYVTTCLPDCPTCFACGNGNCDPGESAWDGCTVMAGMTYCHCPQDCSNIACGNGLCEATESPHSCAHDCGTACGNGECEAGEDVEECPADCGSCGDGICQKHEATGGACILDCITGCGDGKCNDVENQETCPADCAECVPNCQDKQCGADGCGDSCGGCEEEEICREGVCNSSQ